MAHPGAVRSYASAGFCGRACGTRIASRSAMRRARWVLVASLAGLTVACGGATFTIAPGEDSGSSGSSSGGSGSSGSSSGGSGSSGSSSGGSGGGGSSSGGSGNGGSNGGSGGGSGGGSNGGSSGGCVNGCVDSGPPSACPSQLPASGRPCAPNGLACEYGMSPVQSCNSVANCSASVWQIQSPNGSNCASGPGPMCPASFASVPQNTHCTNYGVICDYPQARCACTVTSGPALLDASAVARWICQNPTTAGCPTPRAPLGSACKQQGLSCDYGACSIPGGTSEVCDSGIWKPAMVACPAAASGQ
jgi:hypothetical protein